MSQNLTRVVVRAAAGAAIGVALAGAVPTTTRAEPPTAQTLAAQQKAAAAPEFADRQDFEFASRGFLGTRADPVIRGAGGTPVWSLATYDFLKAPAPPTVEPGLWRQAQLLAMNGLFQVSEGIWQVRGFDLANATFIRGKTGWIVIDTLGSAETAKAAYELVSEKLGKRPIAAVIYTHSHTDHFGGAGGLITPEEARSGRVKVIAPHGFMEAASSENILAGPAMARRAIYQFGVFLKPGPEGQVNAGIGPGLSRGTPALIAPNTLIERDGQEMSVDGVKLVFQLTPDTEAPAEMNIYLPQFRALCMAENANATMHNVLTPRGAVVRDAKGWADQLTRSLRLFGDRTDVMFTSHAWPRFGGEAVRDFLAKHRDAYKYLHDQSVRLMNDGLTGPEIASRIALPPVLAKEWYNHGFYGSMSFNSRAVYQRYMGWYDGDPVHLAARPRTETARRYVEAMGGAAAVRARAQAAFEAGDYAWAAELLDKAVFADPADAEAKALLARAYEQLGYQTQNSLERNEYLSGADELRTGAKGGIGQAGALLAGAPLPLLLDAIAVRLDPAKVGDGRLRLEFVLTEGDRAYVTVENGVLVHEPIAAPGKVDATITLSHADLAAALTGHRPAAGAVKIDGDAGALLRLMSWLEPLSAKPFGLVTP
ncbi:alkyl/aryl-sulfatase [Phenylobacterium soli]|uniref:Alkyl/aryl-sulfatase n=1 Tax=Phenylobacterium soli TaxID=2170551 RepID=A0A328AIB1_9CAUL|nr:alkyl sulfatase dimerization domain-containing protein [Phenylobacterium soli]RAK54255.1 alkyl/aryl-sulfatase [Phenylobacterium soli]